MTYYILSGIFALLGILSIFVRIGPLMPLGFKIAAGFLIMLCAAVLKMRADEHDTKPAAKLWLTLGFIASMIVAVFCMFTARGPMIVPERGWSFEGWVSIQYSVICLWLMIIAALYGQFFQMLTKQGRKLSPGRFVMLIPIAAALLFMLKASGALKDFPPDWAMVIPFALYALAFFNLGRLEGHEHF